MKTANMPQNCGIKGMHENYSKKAEAANSKLPAQIEKARDGRIGNKLDVRV